MRESSMQAFAMSREFALAGGLAPPGGEVPLAVFPLQAPLAMSLHPSQINHSCQGCWRGAAGPWLLDTFSVPPCFKEPPTPCYPSVLFPVGRWMSRCQRDDSASSN